MVLFTNSGFRSSDTLTSTSVLPNLPTRIPGLGYLVFPVPETQHHLPSLHFNNTVDPRTSTAETELGEDHSQTKPEGAQNAAENPLNEQVQHRRALEAAEARKGEEDWVRSGGVLRDNEGRRDWQRTLAIREDLRLRHLEAQITERWDIYEKRWSEVLSRTRQGINSTTNTNLRFRDVPWPVKATGDVEVKVECLTVDHVKDFLLEGLSVRGVKTTKKERIRNSLLRWHPDKLGSLLQQIHPDDTENVNKGLGIVMECLQRLNAQL